MTRPQGLGQLVHTTLKPPLGLQAHVTELGDECSVAQLLCFHWSCSFLAMWDSSLLPFLLPKSMSLDPPQTKGRGISESGPPVKIWTVQNERPFLILSTPRFYGNRHRSHDKIEHLIYNLINGYIINCMFNLTLGLTPFKVKYDYISFNERVLFIWTVRIFNRWVTLRCFVPLKCTKHEWYKGDSDSGFSYMSALLHPHFCWPFSDIMQYLVPGLLISMLHIAHS